MFNIKKAIEKSNLSKKELQKLEEEVHKEFPNDKMMYELHFIRALKSIKHKKTAS